MISITMIHKIHVLSCTVSPSQISYFEVCKNGVCALFSSTAVSVAVISKEKLCDRSMQDQMSLNIYLHQFNYFICVNYALLQLLKSHGMQVSHQFIPFSF